MGHDKAVGRVALGAVSCLMASLACSQETEYVLEQVLVTAAKSGARSVQDVALAVTAFDEASLTARAATSIEDMANFTPGLTFSANGGFAVASMRGIGTNNTFVGGDPSVTTQMDGVYLARPGAIWSDFVDVERVEILRGPQGTLYGRNAVAGTINVNTRNPEFAPEGLLRLSAGNFGHWSAGAFVTGPLVEDKVAGSVAVRASQRDGYIDQLVPNVPDLWDQDSKYVRAKLKWQIDEGLEALFAADYYADEGMMNFYTARVIDSVPDGYEPSDHFEAATNNANEGEVRNQGVSAKLTWETDAVTLTSLTAYRDWEQLYIADIDGTALELLYTRWFPESQHQFSQEFSAYGSAGGFDWVAGAMYFTEAIRSSFTLEIHDLDLDGDSAADTDLLQTEYAETETQSVSVFAQANRALGERWTLTAGMRYTRDEKEQLNTFGLDAYSAGQLPQDVPRSTLAALQPPQTDKKTFSAGTPKLGLEFRPGEDTLLYASATRGFKSGGYNFVTSVSGGAPVSYDEETVTAFEIGAKMSLAGGRLTLNTTAFRYDYEDLQVLQFVPYSGGTIINVVANAPGAISSGAEVEFALRAGEGFRMGGFVAYLDTEYDGSFLVNSGGVLTDANDGRLTDAPEWTGSLYAEQTWPVTQQLEFRARVEGRYKGEAYFSPANLELEKAASYSLIDASIALASMDGAWDVSLIGRNLADKAYLTGTNTFAQPTGRPGVPRTVILGMTYNF